MALTLKDVYDLKRRIDETGYAGRNKNFADEYNDRWLIPLLTAVQNATGTHPDMLSPETVFDETDAWGEEIGILYNGLNEWFRKCLHDHPDVLVNEFLHNRLSGKLTLGAVSK